MPAYMINGEHFRTQKALKERIQKILSAYSPNEALDEPDTMFLYALVKGHHPSSEVKTGSGVARIEVRLNQVYKRNREFWIVRTDGTETDFSFIECLRPSRPIDKFRTACRTAISPYVAEVKASYWS